MKQLCSLVRHSEYESLRLLIQDEIGNRNDEGFKLVNIQYFGLETDAYYCSAWLLFDEIEEKSNG